MRTLILKVKRYKYLLITLMFIVLGFLLWGNISFHNNIWYDEAYQMILNRQSLLSIISYVSKDTSGPLYAISLKFFTTIFGEKIYIGRILSILIFCIQFILAFYPIRRLYNAKVSFIMSILLLLSSVSLFAAVEIRTYSIAMTCTLGAAVYSELYFKTKNKSDLIKSFLFSLCALYTHNYAMVCVGIITAVNLIRSIFVEKDKAYIIANIILILCYLPWCIILINQYQLISNNYWISKATPFLLKQVVDNIFTSNEIINVTLFILLVTSIIISKKQHKETRDTFYQLIPVIITIALTYTWSLINTPIFMPKYTTPLCGIIYLFIAKTLGRNKNIVIPIIYVLLMIPYFMNNYIDEVKLTDDTETKKAISIIEDLPKESFSFYDVNEFLLGIEQYYFPNYKHYVDPSLEYVLSTPEIYGNITREINMQERIVVSLTPLSSPNNQSSFFLSKGYNLIASYSFNIPYNDGFNLYIYEKEITQ